MLEGIFSIFFKTLSSFLASAFLIPLFAAAVFYGVVVLIKKFI